MSDELVTIQLKWSTICAIRKLLAKKAYTVSKKYVAIDEELAEAVKKTDLDKVKEI